jgi:hypothetical protein
MKSRSLAAAALLIALLCVGLALFRSREPASQLASSQPAAEQVQPAPLPTVSAPEPPPVLATPAAPPTESVVAQAEAVTAKPGTNKLERLDRIRETFRALATGDPKRALAAVREITDESEREVALMTLLTAWRHGELAPPRQRAAAIANFGLEAGLGLELTKDPELTALWANELTDGENRTTLLISAAHQVVDTNPIAAIAWAQQLPDDQRSKVLDSVLAEWAGKDTDEALNWAQQISDPGQRDSAIQAMRQGAPVGIGAELQVKDGYPVITGLVPGAPIELSGQVHPGDRIVGIAQGDNVFVDTRTLSLQEVVQVIRGAPGSQVQIQVLAANAGPDDLPRTIPIIRQQIRFKR